MQDIVPSFQENLLIRQSALPPVWKAAAVRRANKFRALARLTK